MQDIKTLALLAGLTAFGVSILSTPLVIRIAWWLGIVDDPKKNRHPKVIHTYPVPRGGGLAIFLAVATAIFIFLPLDKHILAILLGMFILLVMGLIDDKYNLSPYPRFLVQFVAAALPIAGGIGIAFITNPLGGGMIDLSQPQITFELLGKTRSIWVLSDAFAILWIVALMNFLNIGAKGVDGQLPGVVGIAALTITVLSLGFSADITQWPVIILASITAGAYFGFLPWNMYPQKIMPSFSGSNIAGFLLAVLSILSTTKVGTLVVVLGLPLIDTTYTILRRLLQKKSPFYGDRGHLHHRLLDAGLTKSQVAFFYWGLTAMLGTFALNLNSTLKLYTMVFIVFFVGGLIFWLMHLGSISSKRKA